MAGAYFISFLILTGNFFIVFLLFELSFYFEENETFSSVVGNEYISLQIAVPAFINYAVI